MEHLLSMLGLSAFALVGCEAIRRAYVRKTGQHIGYVRFLIVFVSAPSVVAATLRRPFDGRNGYALVGFDWVLVLGSIVLSARWAVTGTGTDALLAGASGAAVVGLMVWRIQTGRTGETVWHAGPARDGR